MNILVIGSGGVGTAFARIAQRRDFFDRIILSDLDATDVASLAALIRALRADAVLNAVDPRFVMPIFRAALAADCTYLDMAMSLSHPHPDHPHEQTGVKLGDEQFAMAADGERSGKERL